MKKCFVFVMLAAVLLMSGCSLPAVDNFTDDTNSSEISGNNDTQETDFSSEVKTDETNTEKKDVKEKIGLTFYFQDKDGNVIPVTRQVEKQEGIARSAVNGLIDNSINREKLQYYGLYPVLPKGTEILGLTIRDGIAIIDFNNKLFEYTTKAAERAAITSIVYTLTEFNTIDGVKILVNGYTINTLKFGAEIGQPLNRNNIMMNCDDVNTEHSTSKIDCYLLKPGTGEFTYILPVSVYTAEDDIDAMPEKIMDSLTRNIPDETYIYEVPEGLELLESSHKGNLLTLNFGGSMGSYGGTLKEELLLKQILYSMKQIDGVEKVKILIEGKSVLLPEGTDISKELPIPSGINDVMDN